MKKMWTMSTKLFFVATLAISVARVPRLGAQVQTEVPAVVPGAKAVTVEHIKIHAEALEGNLEGEAVDRDVIVFLPPGYAKEKHRRYPVVYALHGYSIGAEQWTHEIHVPQTIEGAFAQGSQEMIVVLPDSKTVYGGSMYSTPSPQATLSGSLPATWSPMLTLTTAPFLSARAGGWWAIPWAAMAPHASE